MQEVGQLKKFKFSDMGLINKNSPTNNGTLFAVQAWSEGVRKQMISLMLPTGETVNPGTQVPIYLGSQNGMYSPNLTNNVMKYNAVQEHSAINHIIMGNQSNTTMKVHIYYVKARRNIPKVTELYTDGPAGYVYHINNIFRYDLYNQSDDLKTAAQQNSYLQNPLVNIFDFPNFTKFYKVTTTTTRSILPGKEETFLLSNKIKRRLDGFDINTYNFMKNDTFILFKLNGQQICDQDGNVSYSDYNLVFRELREYAFKTIPFQLRPMPKLQEPRVLNPPIWVMNPISGFLESEQDTFTGPQSNDSAYAKNTGIPVVITNAVTYPVPVVSATLSKVKPMKSRRTKKNLKKSLDEEFKDL